MCGHGGKKEEMRQKGKIWEGGGDIGERGGDSILRPVQNYGVFF